MWKLHEAAQPYAQWSRGFRAPTPDQVNNGFSNPASGYRSIGNPDLKAERAESVEVGLRGAAGSTWRWQLAAYDNRYRDFISQQQVGGSFTPGDPAVFQYINLAQARIRGFEARLHWNPAPGWSLRSAYATARGDSELRGTKTPLATVEPARGHLGVEHTRGAWSWRGGLAYDQTPVRDAFRTPRLPDNDRVWLTAGAQFQPARDWRFDLGAAFPAPERNPFIQDGMGANYALHPKQLTPAEAALGWAIQKVRRTGGARNGWQ